MKDNDNNISNKQISYFSHLFEKFKELKNVLFNDFPGSISTSELKDNLCFDFKHIYNNLLVDQNSLQQLLYSNKQFTNIEGVVIKINSMKNNMIFLKVLSLQDFIHSFKVVLCFENAEIHRIFNENINLYDYVWTSNNSNIFFNFQVEDII